MVKQVFWPGLSFWPWGHFKMLLTSDSKSTKKIRLSAD